MGRLCAIAARNSTPEHALVFTPHSAMMRGMSWILRIFLVGIFLGGNVGQAEEAAPEWKFRTITVQVLDIKGKPAPGVTVSLVGLDRDALYQINDDRNASKWRFFTDAQGCFTARFGDFRSYDYEQATGKWEPGWGVFYFVAECKGTAGGVSPYLQNESREYERLTSLPRGEHDEWRTGEFAPVDLSKQPAKVVIRLKSGITVFGKVTDEVGNPLAGHGIRVEEDLHAWSHTGRGGEILAATGVTDRKGRYRIENVYPNRFYIQLEPNAPLFWLKTRLRKGTWEEGRVDEVQPYNTEKEVRVDLIAAKEAPYRYYGKVTDATGQPVAHAKVTLGVSLHWPTRTWGDDHHFESVETGEDGTYEIRVESRYVRGFSVEAPGFERMDRWNDDRASFNSEKPFAPGAYDFQVTKEDPSKKKP